MAPPISAFAAKLANQVASHVTKMEDASHETSAFRKKLDELYPGAINYEEGVVRVTHVLNRYGFTADTAIALVSQCRDEVVYPYVHAIDLNFKGSFNLSSFAGTVLSGKTAFTAALHHAPTNSDGKERYVVFCGPHIAIDAEGNVGPMTRRGQKATSSACTSIIRFQKELESGTCDMALDYLNLEYTAFKRRMMGQVTFFGADLPSLTELTHTCHEATMEDVRSIMDSVTPGADECNYAIVSGILIHGPDDTHYLWQGDVEATINGVTTDLRDEVCRVSRDEYTPAMIRYIALKAEETSSAELTLQAMALQDGADPYAAMSYATSETTAFREKLDAFYPGAMHHEEAAVRVTHALRQHGFTAQSTMAITAQCRDEICKPFVEAISTNWSGSFNLGSLAGTVNAGTNGFTAALSHAPQNADGVGRYVVFCGPHIAIDADGNIGKVVRRGRAGLGNACGALIGFCGMLQARTIDTSEKAHDVEFTGLKRRLTQDMKVFGKGPPDIVELTKLCHDVTVDDVRKIMPQITKGPCEYAIVSGILVHGPEGSHYFWQNGVEVIKGGVATDISAHVEKATRQDYLPTMKAYLARKPDDNVCPVCVTDVDVEQTPTTASVM